MFLYKWSSFELFDSGMAPGFYRANAQHACHLYVILQFLSLDFQDEIVETYRILITKESPDEKVILRDIHRTFPAHEFFKEAGGVGQESLYRISKAYSVYDSEIGYCQVCTRLNRMDFF